ncbi:MAG: RidA family protein [Roseibacillus sp.]|nr:hypothetical protein [Roseibacillus sp.]MDP7307345.1 RidA family protein [Roseibacillus sp.]HJM62126.1 RidA family protein [Roseibacillus sp.]
MKTISTIEPSTEPSNANQFRREICRTGCSESFLMFLSRSGDNPTAMFDRMDDHLRHRDGKVARKDSIGLLNTQGTATLQQRYCCDCDDCPLNVSVGEAHTDCPVTGLYVHTVSGTPVEPVWLGGRIVGTIYEDAHARYCQLKEIHPDSRLSREEQARQIFERMESALHQVGMSFSHVVRTWLFVDDILDWYDELNQIRDQFFTTRGIYDGLVPASTGVGASNSSGSAITCSLTAVMPKTENVIIEAVPSPLQGAALEYGSSFSRAVELAMPDHRRLLVSGTASIAPSGETLHVGDVDEQVALTMRVVEAILESRGMNWADVTRGAAYFKHLEDLPAYDRFCREHDVTELPVAVVQNDVCRDDLLFEIEVDAIGEA